MKRLKRIAIICVVTYLGVVCLLAWLETTLMYPAPTAAEGDWKPNWLQFEDVTFNTLQGNEIHGWFCEHPNPAHVILLCHGNGEHVAYMAEELDFLREQFSASVFAFDYRGYGKSPGRPFEAGIKVDAEAAHTWLADRTGLEPGSIVLWGRSLGGAVAIHLAAKSGAEALVLDRTFSSMVDVAANHYPWLPVRWLLSNRYQSEQRIQSYSGPLIQFHGKPDRVVPYRFGRQLFDAAPSDRKNFVSSESLGHNSPWPTEHYSAVMAFLTEL